MHMYTYVCIGMYSTYVCMYVHTYVHNYVPYGTAQFKLQTCMWVYLLTEVNVQNLV